MLGINIVQTSVSFKSLMLGCILGLGTSCLGDEELCDPSEGEVSLKPIAKGADLSGWWEGGVASGSRSLLLQIDSKQSPRKWYRNDGAIFNIEPGEYDFGCDGAKEYPLVIGGYNRKAEECGGGVWGGGGGSSSGDTITLEEFEWIDGWFCLRYRFTSTHKLSIYFDEPKDEYWCYSYDESTDTISVLSELEVVDTESLGVTFHRREEKKVGES